MTEINDLTWHEARVFYLLCEWVRTRLVPHVAGHCVPTDPNSRMPNSIREILGAVNAEFRRIQCVEGVDLRRWEVRAWEPERELQIYRRITLIAIGPDGIGHGLADTYQGYMADRADLRATPALPQAARGSGP